MFFANTKDEIQHLKQEAELGCSKAQHRIGMLHIQEKRNLENLFEAYKWLFISVALGNEKARKDLIKVNSLFGSDEEIELCFDLVLEWFDEKFDIDNLGEEEKWKPELLKWRFSSANVH
jgi:TPR repeat protein